MRTDKEIFKILQECPEFVGMLAGFDDDGPATMESVTVKEIQRSMDGLVRPEDSERPLTVVEVQFQLSETIYNRIVIEMSSVQETNGMRAIRGVIFFASRSLDPAVEPWVSSVTSVYLDEILEAREKVDDADPVVAVFKPVFEKDTERLELEAARHYRAIKNASGLSARQAEVLAQIFTHWLFERLGSRNIKEIAMILDLPDIEETRAGKELIGIGLERGMERGIERGIVEGQELGMEKSILTIARRRFGLDGITPAVEAAVRDLKPEALEMLLVELIDLEDLAAFKAMVSRLA